MLLIKEIKPEEASEYVSKSISMYKQFCFLMSSEGIESKKDVKAFTRYASKKIESLGDNYKEFFVDDPRAIEFFSAFIFEEKRKKDIILEALYESFDAIEKNIEALRKYKDIVCLVDEMIATSEKIAMQIEKIEKEIKLRRNVLDNCFFVG